MKITSNEEYGLRILLRVATLSLSDSQARLVTLNEIASGEGISTDYAMIFITSLKNASLIESVRGKNGGYKLTKEPSQITLLEVSKSLTKETFGSEYCDKHSGGQMEHCIHSEDCTIRSVWFSITSLVDELLSTITIQDLMNNNEKSLQKLINDKLIKGELAKAI